MTASSRTTSAHPFCALSAPDRAAALLDVGTAEVRYPPDGDDQTALVTGVRRIQGHRVLLAVTDGHRASADHRRTLTTGWAGDQARHPGMDGRTA